MELKKEFVKNCRKIGALQEFLCQAIDQIDEKDTKIIQLEALIENYNRISGEIIDNANHQKHKRCLALASNCALQKKKLKLLNLEDDFVEIVKIRAVKIQRWDKWCNRWLSLAGKFNKAQKSQRRHI